MKKTCFYFLLPFLVWMQVALAQEKTTPAFSIPRLERIDHVLQQYVDSNWIKGAVAYIYKDGKPVYVKAFGWDGQRKMQTDAIFRIASQTKAITCVATMMLYEEGKFLLDDPVSKYLPAFAHSRVLDKFNGQDSSYTTVPAKREITIRDLLTHTSGIDYAQIGSPSMKPIYAKAGIEAGFVAHKVLLADVVDKLGTLPLVHQPGEKWTYGMNMEVLGRLVEVFSGMNLDVFFRKRIFEPLQMKDTYFQLPQEKQNRLVKVYTVDTNAHTLRPWDKNTFPGVSVDYPVNHNGYFAGGAGIVSTIEDYGKLLQMLLNGGIYNGQRLLSPRSVKLMTMNQIGDLPWGDNRFGLGFEITTEKGMSKQGRTVGSFGWGGFFSTVYWVDPKENLIAQLYMQQNPFPHGELFGKFNVLVYQALQ